MTYLTVEVEIDLLEHICSIPTETLEEELASRNNSHPNKDILLEGVYYALRDRDIDSVIEIINPLLEYEIGRAVL